MDPAANMAAASPGIEPQFIGMTVAVATHCVNTTSIAMKKRNRRRSAPMVRAPTFIAGRTCSLKAK
jgi:hypothetical protein